MKLQIPDLTTDRQWSAATGCTRVQFEKLLVLFTASYLELHRKPVAERQAEIEVTSICLAHQDVGPGLNEYNRRVDTLSRERRRNAERTRLPGSHATL